MKKFIFLIIFSIIGILFSGGGCFYRAVTNDIFNMIFNGVLCVLDIAFLTFFIDKLLKLKTK